MRMFGVDARKRTRRDRVDTEFWRIYPIVGLANRATERGKRRISGMGLLSFDGQAKIGRCAIGKLSETRPRSSGKMLKKRRQLKITITAGGIV